MTILNIGRMAAAFVLSEAEHMRSRDNGVLAASQTIVPGQVLGRIASGTAGISVTAAPVAGNTGDGVLTLASPAFASTVKEGKYRLVCITAVANAGKFRVEDREGVEIGTCNVGSAFIKQVKFSIADGATDFVVGDAFEIIVALTEATEEQYKAFDPTATDGSENPYCIALYGTTTGAGVTQSISFISRDAEILTSELVFLPGITADQTTLALSALKRRGMIPR